MLESDCFIGSSINGGISATWNIKLHKFASNVRIMGTWRLSILTDFWIQSLYTAMVRRMAGEQENGNKKACLKISKTKFTFSRLPNRTSRTTLNDKQNISSLEEIIHRIRTLVNTKVMIEIKASVRILSNGGILSARCTTLWDFVILISCWPAMNVRVTEDSVVLVFNIN